MEYYAVKVGRLPVIYNENEDWYSQVEGFKYAEYKVFKDLESARKYMKSKSASKKKTSTYKGSKFNVFKTKKNFY